MLNVLRIFFLLFFLSPLCAQTIDSSTVQDVELIKEFVRDIADETQRPDVIISKHVLLKQTHTDEVYDYLEASIEEIRVNLQFKNIDELAYVPFETLPKREIRDIDPEGKPTNKMYFLKYRKRQLLAVYIVDDKIASFTLVSKGQKAHFVTY